MNSIHSFYSSILEFSTNVLARNPQHEISSLIIKLDDKKKRAHTMIILHFLNLLLPLSTIPFSFLSRRSDRSRGVEAYRSHRHRPIRTTLTSWVRQSFHRTCGQRIFSSPFPPRAIGTFWRTRYQMTGCKQAPPKGHPSNVFKNASQKD